MPATRDQLRDRWLTDDGKRRRDAVVEAARRLSDWTSLLEGFPYVQEVSNRRDLRCADLVGVDLTCASLTEADLRHALLWSAVLRGANLTRADLRGAGLNCADLSIYYYAGTEPWQVLLKGARLSGADLVLANLTGATLLDADLQGSYLRKSNFTSAYLKGADFSGAVCEDTVFADVDLSEAKGLAAVQHEGPSTIGIDTLYRSQGRIPKEFMRGCGVPGILIEELPSLIAGVGPSGLHSCFISYSHTDEEFAKHLHCRMQGEGMRVWYAPEDVKGGRKLYEQIEKAIETHDKLLVVLSKRSLQSEWVMTEIRNARRQELRKGQRKLFPIRLVDIDTIRAWKCFDPDTGKDLAVEVREYFIPDFSDWQDGVAFEGAFQRLLDDLKTEEAKGEKGQRQ